mmetsp:Transcript_7662/g.8357  ORF Transcript_7662/g.8357 Transcript_7662/m.8357 type:complete len:534 (-) Transcript_7662:284-1885(-)
MDKKKDDGSGFLRDFFSASQFTPQKRSKTPIGSQSVNRGYTPSKLAAPTSEMKPSGHHHTPSPIIKEKYTDRYIPYRSASNLTTMLTSNLDDFLTKKQSQDQISTPSSINEDSQEAYSSLLKSQLLGLSPSEDTKDTERPSDRYMTPTKSGTSSSLSSLSGISGGKMFRYKVENNQRGVDSVATHGGLGNGLLDQEKLASPMKKSRKIAKGPYKILDAPNLMDDFYLNLVDWSCSNVLAVGLRNNVHLWNADTAEVIDLCSFRADEPVTSVSFAKTTDYLAIGTERGTVQVWDSAEKRLIMDKRGMTAARVGVLGWNSPDILTIGCKDGAIKNIDVATGTILFQYEGHKQEACGLEWSVDGKQLASGGNDNKVLIWNIDTTVPQGRLTNHSAAVKALAWSPHKSHILCTGGGSLDPTIRIWNTTNFTQIDCINTGSQVCNLIFSPHYNEFVSTHGYSENQITIWKFPTLERVGTLTGHTSRVLYLAISPDGENIVTGAGDETLRFWKVFPKEKVKVEKHVGSFLTKPYDSSIR